MNKQTNKISFLLDLIFYWKETNNREINKSVNSMLNVFKCHNKKERERKKEIKKRKKEIAGKVN